MQVNGVRRAATSVGAADVVKPYARAAEAAKMEEEYRGFLRDAMEMSVGCAPLSASPYDTPPALAPAQQQPRRAQQLPIRINFTGKIHTGKIEKFTHPGQRTHVPTNRRHNSLGPFGLTSHRPCFF